MSSEWSNLKEVARDLDVHYMTAYRYVRQGRLPATWIDNGWRIHRNDLQEFRSRSASTSVDADRRESGAPAHRSGDTPAAASADWAARLMGRLTNGDETGAWAVMEAALAAGLDVRGCYLDVLSVALAELGNEWQHDPTASLVDERLATATALRIVHRLGSRFSRPGRRKGTIVLGAPAGEHHTLPVAIAADLIRLEGFTVLELGADVSSETFVAAAHRAERLVAVGISLTTTAALDATIETRELLQNELPNVPILIGGQAVGNEVVAKALGSAGYANDGDEFAALLKGVVGRPSNASAN